MPEAKSGVFQDEAGQWTWYCPETQTTGTAVASRAAAREAYQAHRREHGLIKSATPAPAATTSTAAPAVTSTQEKKMATKAKSKKTTRKNGKRSSGAVAKVWDICGKLGKNRAKVLEAAAAAGINPNTAKTQYQRWLHRGDK